MMTQLEHTPTPWKYEIQFDQSIFIISTDRPLNIANCGFTNEDYKNAVFIVRAVNNHENMKEALKDILYAFRDNAPHLERVAALVGAEKALIKAIGDQQ